MTPRQQQAEIRRQATEIAKAQRAAERERAAQARAQREAQKAQQRTINTVIRTGGRLATSRLGQDVVRGIFGTLFGGKRG
jgi:septal ring factor EnvC (AmiA/AmiB activator)